MKTVKNMESIKIILSKCYLLLVLILLMIMFSILSPVFFTPVNLTNVLVQNAYVVIATIGIALIMISGGADLSVSYQIGLISVICGYFLMNTKVPTGIVVIMGVALGVLLGFINGILTAMLKVQSIVVTLATMTVFQGVAYVICGAKTFYNFPDSFKRIGQSYIGGVLPICVIIMVVMFLLAYFILNKLHTGRYIYAIGGNEEASRLAGINTKMVRIIAFSLSGFFLGVASVVLTSKIGSASPSIASDAVFVCFTACVLGGISFRGGEGNIVNIFFSVLILGVLSNGMQLIGLTIYSQYIVKGILLIIAIAFDQYQKNARVKSDSRAMSK